MQISGKKIKELRTEKGMSRAKLSEKSGIPLRTLESWENEKRIPRDVYIIKSLCDTLGVSIDYLFYDEFADIDTLYNFDVSDCEDAKINSLVQQIYNKQELTGILRLMDRFIFAVGPMHAIKIMEAFINESN